MRYVSIVYENDWVGVAINMTTEQDPDLNIFVSKTFHMSDK